MSFPEKEKFGELIDEYQKEHSGYFPKKPSKMGFLNVFEIYCNALNECVNPEEVIQTGIKYCEEKIESYRTGDAIFIIYFALLSRSGKLFEFEKNEERKEIFERVIRSVESNRFQHDPGTNINITRKAHDDWWWLMRAEHVLAKEFIERPNNQVDSLKTSDKLNEVLSILADLEGSIKATHSDTVDFWENSLGEQNKLLAKIKNEGLEIRDVIQKEKNNLRNDIVRISSETKEETFEKLSELSDNLSKNNKTSDYGHHQERAEWVKNKWVEIREGKTSDRKADLELIAAYKEKYNGEIISTSTIQRYTGRQ